MRKRENERRGWRRAGAEEREKTVMRARAGYGRGGLMLDRAVMLIGYSG